MKIAVVSDTHNNMANFENALEWLNSQKIQLVLHCGDISTQDTIDQAKKFFKGEIKFVKGNADYDLSNLPEKLEIEIEKKKIVFLHFPDEAKKLAQSGNYDLVFYGHTHKPWEENVGDCRLINPGELAGQIFKPTFAVYDTNTDKLELKILERL